MEDTPSQSEDWKTVLEREAIAPDSVRADGEDPKIADAETTELAVPASRSIPAKKADSTRTQGAVQEDIPALPFLVRSSQQRPASDATAALPRKPLEEIEIGRVSRSTTDSAAAEAPSEAAMERQTLVRTGIETGSDTQHAGAVNQVGWSSGVLSRVEARER